jgi:hypothetical protein
MSEIGFDENGSILVLVGIDDAHNESPPLRGIKNKALPHRVGAGEAGSYVVQAGPQSSFCGGIPTVQPGGPFRMPRGRFANRFSADDIHRA